MSGGQSGNSSNPEGKGQKQQESGKRKDDSASRPDEQGKPEEQSGEKPGEGEIPKDNTQSDAEPEPNKQGKLPEAQAGNANGGDPQVEVWGNLPIHLRDIFRAEGGVDVPAQYRDWIDSYYRRLNRRGE